MSHERTGHERVIAAVAAAGIVMAANLALAPLTGVALFCAPQSDCGLVHAGRYARLLGVPTSAWGIAHYAVVAATALLGLTPRRWLGVFVLAVTGLSTSAYLAYVAQFVIGARCAYCLVSLAVAAALLVTLLRTWPAPANRPSWLRPRALALIASVTAAVTVAVIAAVFRASAAP